MKRLVFFMLKFNNLWIDKTMFFSNVLSIKLLYRLMAIQRLEYAFVTWFPDQVKYIRALEKIIQTICYFIIRVHLPLNTITFISSIKCVARLLQSSRLHSFSVSFASSKNSMLNLL